MSIPVVNWTESMKSFLTRCVPNGEVHFMSLHCDLLILESCLSEMNTIYQEEKKINFSNSSPRGWADMSFDYPPAGWRGETC